MKNLLFKKYNFMALSSIFIIFLFLTATDFYYTWRTNTDRLSRDASNATIYAEETVSQIKNYLFSLSKAPVIRTKDSKKVSQFLQSLGDLPQVTSIEIASTDGIRWAGKNRSIGIMSVKDREFYNGTMKTGQPYITNVVISKLYKRPEFIITYPIYKNDNKTFDDMFFAPVWTTRFGAVMNKLKLNSGGNLHIVDNKGYLLFSTIENYNYLKIYKPFLDKTSSNSILASLLKLKYGKVCAQQSINGTSWTVIADMDTKAFLNLVMRKVLIDVLLIFLLLLPLTGIFILFVIQLNKQKEDLIRTNKKLQGLATTDGLTGLLNHRAFQDTLSKCLKEAGPYNPVTLLLIDIDNFKIFNDHYGHQVGDSALKLLSRLMRSYFNGHGNVARYGGEEFVVILPDTNHKKGYTLARHLCELISSTPLKISDQEEAKITVSIGLASYPKDASDRENLIRFADRALYKAKEQESNKVQMYYSVLEELRENIESDQDLMKIIHTLNTIINTKDKYTYGHSERVMNYASKLAQHMGLPKDDIHNITIGAFLHDIGKIEISGEILNKPGKLNAEEFEAVKKHPLIGAEIIQPIKSLKKAIDFALYHHERYDGSGYPFGLKGEEIPLYGRIAAVVDSFDAMTTKRPYQNVKTTEEAIEEIKKCSGTQFDPKIVDYFVDLYLKHASNDSNGQGIPELA